MGNYCAVRGYLLMSLVFDNATRPGAISNIMLDECKRATNRDNGYVIRVIKHKAAHKGPVNIACAPSLFREIRIYVKYLRNKIEGTSTDPDDTVFVSQSGGAMDSSPIIMQMSYFWKRALKIDITGPSRISPTLVRKYTTSAVHQHVPEIKLSTANLLCHSSRVTESNYALYDKQKKAVNASNMVQDVQRSTFEEGDKTNTEDSLKCSSRMSSKITRYDQIPFEDFFIRYKKSYLFS